MKYRIDILEKTPVDSAVAIAIATDLDSGENAKINYSMAGESWVMQYFKIDMRSGLIQVAQQIDRSDLIRRGFVSGIGNVTLTVNLRATDRGDPPLIGEAVLFVTVNEASEDIPQFAQAVYEVDILEGAPNGMYLI